MLFWCCFSVVTLVIIVLGDFGVNVDDNFGVIVTGGAFMNCVVVVTGIFVILVSFVAGFVVFTGVIVLVLCD
jgi:hypothetical protein